MVIMMEMKLHHVGFVVSDLDRSVDFYTKVLGFQLHDRWKEGPEMCEVGMCVPGASLELAQVVGHGVMVELYQYLESSGSREPIAPNHVGLGHLSLGVDDFGAFMAQLQAHHVPLCSDIVKLTKGQWVHFFDPDGIRIEVMGKL